MHILLEAVKERAIGVHALVRPDMTVQAVCRVMGKERAVTQHELRRQLIHHLPVFCPHHYLIGKHLQVASQNKGVMAEETCQTFRQLVHTCIQFINILQFVPLAVRSKSVQRRNKPQILCEHIICF